MSKILTFSILTVGLVIMLFGLSNSVLALDTIEQEILAEITIDEAVTAEDLGVSEPTILPDSPFYFFKEWQRGITSFFTFNPIKKAKLHLRYASEKVLEMKKIAEKTNNVKTIEKASENYQKEVEKVSARVNKIKEKASENEDVSNFLDKFTQQQIFHDKVLGKVESQVPVQAVERIRIVRVKQFEKFGEVINKLENKEQMQVRLEKNFQQIKGSDFQDFKTAEILKRLQDRAPESIKEEIQRVREGTLNQLGQKLKEMPVEEQERFRQYTEKVQGQASQKIETLQELQSEFNDTPELQQKMEDAEEKIKERVREKAGIKK